MNISYPAYFQHDGQNKRYLISFPDIPEAISEAETLEEARFNAREALSLSLKARTKEGMHIPLPSQIENAEMIEPL